MFKEFFLFEIKYSLKRPMIYVFVLLNFAMLYAATAIDNVTIGGFNEAVHVNSPYVITSTVLLMTLIGIFMTTAFMNTSILRDFDNGFDEIMFSAPLSKLGYLGGRFSGALLMALIPTLGMFAGILFGSMSPSVAESQVGLFNFDAYWSTFWIGVIPNTILIASFVFMMAALYRSNIFSFIAAMAIVVGYMIMTTVSRDLDNELIAIIADPLAYSSYLTTTKYWTVVEKNTQVLTLSGPLLINRILWLVVSLVFMVITYFRFSFAKKSSIFSKKKDTTILSPWTPAFSKLNVLPKVSTDHSMANSWSQLWHQTKMEFWGIIKSAPFIVLLAIGFINMLATVPFVHHSFGTGNHPVTYIMVETIRGSLFLFLIGIVMYYSGVVIWKERDAKMNEFFDASPIATWIPFVSKLMALIGITAVILIMAIGCGVFSQTLAGYSNFQFSVYFREFLVYDLLTFSTAIVLSMLVQTIVNNKYLGYFAFLLIMIAMQYGPSGVGIKSNLLIFGSTPSYIYSDMNGWGPYAEGLAWFHTYWVLFASLLAIGGVLFWVRGYSSSWKQRWAIAKQRFSGRLVAITSVFGLLWIITTSFLFYQTQVVNEIQSEDNVDLLDYEYERDYKKYEHIAQPRYTDIAYELDIYPEERNFEVRANVVAQNKTKESIDRVHFTLQDDVSIEIDLPDATLELDDVSHLYRIYKLSSPLMPGESIDFAVKVTYEAQGIENEVSNNSIVSNGTFLHNYKLMPTIGYNSGKELSSKNKRAEFGLKPRDRMAALHANCSHACQNTYIRGDSDWITISTTLSTSADQIAIAPGSLVKEWTQDNRAYYQYELNNKVLNFFSFVSGRYVVERDVWQSDDGQKVDIEIYYHKGHEYNVDKMVKSVSRSLTYFAREFGAYPHGEARIVEFPRYAGFAQAFPGTMPYSERMGFMANLNEKDAIDMVYYTVAHEMAHQWWGHQVVGANVQGATMLSETFAQYSALMVMQQEYGKDKMKQFMKHEMDGYLRSRGGEQRKELPLLFNENQQYIHYKKGSVAMYALQDYIGVDSVNMALNRYVEAVAFQEAPYTTSLEVMEYFDKITPDSLQYLVDDMFRKITLYSNKTINASYKPLDNGKYEVNIDVTVEKYNADSIGRETLIPHDDYIDIGVFSEEINEGEKYGRPIAMERHRISEKENSFTIIVDEAPYTAGIDPNYLLVDRFPEDNVKKLERVE